MIKIVSHLFFLIFIMTSCVQNTKKNNSLQLLLLWQVINATPVCFGKDPLLKNQWHIKNTGQGGGVAGNDANVVPLWEQSIFGRDVYVAVVDDGVDIDHPDLIANTRHSYHWNFIDKNNQIKPYTSNYPHGTSVAGVIGARCNDIGVRGLAPLSKLVGYNLLLANTINTLDNNTSAVQSDTAEAMIKNKDVIQISNNSWGAPDGTGELMDEFAGTLWKESIIDGVRNGRGGKGIIYLWAGGNGSTKVTTTNNNIVLLIDQVDDSNHDGQANFLPYIMAICAVTNLGKHSYYSELGANIWVCGYSDPLYNEGTLAITTTDIQGNDGYNPPKDPEETDNPDVNYTDTFGGTSAATPFVAGIVALMLEANPNLTWRDIRYILAKTARRIDPFDSDWKQNGAGFFFNHKYGFGVADAFSAVNLAKNFTSLGNYNNLKKTATNYDIANQNIPDNNSIGITRNMNVSSNITKIEGVQVEVQFSHQYFGDLEITLKSPSGTTAVLTRKHRCYKDANNDPSDGLETESCNSYTNKTWVFSAANFLDENPNGNWSLTVKDLGLDDIGQLHRWKLIIFGR
ncbi:MAG: S8 family peptidase [Leptospiraceae bacterium]|nr:S8 family peptidase [Leptospiraceae bacterium]